MDSEIEDLAGRVRVLSPRAVFTGAYSNVYRGELDLQREMVAVKVINPIRGIPISTILRKLERERRTWSRLRHPNILPLYGFANDHELFEPFGALISPWRERGDLGNYLQEHGQAISLYERVKLWAGIVAGVTYLHHNNPVEVVIHGDLKPWNILIGEDGVPEICDFGLTRVMLEEGASTGTTTTTAHTGTARYLAYELVMGHPVTSTATDIYATGCIGLELLYQVIPYSECGNTMNILHLIYTEMVAGNPPAPRPNVLTPTLKPLWKFVSWCWARDPDDRPDAVALSAGLAGMLSSSHFPETALSNSVPEESQQRRRELPQLSTDTVVASQPPVPTSQASTSNASPSSAKVASTPPASPQERPSSRGTISSPPPNPNSSPVTTQSHLRKFLQKLPRPGSYSAVSRGSNETLARTQSGSSNHGSVEHSQSNSTAPSNSSATFISNRPTLSPEQALLDLPTTPSPSSSLGRNPSPIPSIPSTSPIRRRPSNLNREDTVVPVNRPSISTSTSSDGGPVMSSISRALDLCLLKEAKRGICYYQDGEPVEGRVVLNLKSLDQVDQVEVTLEGNLRVVYSRGAMRYKHIDIPLFKESKKLLSGPADSTLRESHDFTFLCPELYAHGNTPLPPTWSFAHPGIEAEVSYTIRAALKRKNHPWGGRDEAHGKLGYYPRIATPLTEPLSPGRLERPKLRVLELDRDVRPKVVLRTRITLCVPQTYALGSPIPYAVYFYSPNGTSIPASIDLEVSIIRAAKFVIHKEPYEKKDVISRGVNHDKQLVEDQRPLNDKKHKPGLGGPFTIRGSCTVGTEAREITWSVDEVASIKYAMRFVVTPKLLSTGSDTLRNAIPPFEHVEEIVLTSDSSYALSPEMETKLPATPRLGQRNTRSLTNASTDTQPAKNLPVSGDKVPALVLSNSITQEGWGAEFTWMASTIEKGARP